MPNLQRLRANQIVRRVGLAVAAGSLAMSAPAPAQDQDGRRIDSLEARIAAQQLEIEALTHQVRDLLAGRGASAAGPAIGQEGLIPAPAAQQGVTPPAVLTAADGVTIKPKGRLQVDALALNSGAGSSPTATQLRRLQMGAEGMIAPDWRYAVEVAFAGRQVGLEDAHARAERRSMNPSQRFELFPFARLALRPRLHFTRARTNPAVNVSSLPDWRPVSENCTPPLLTR